MLLTVFAVLSVVTSFASFVPYTVNMLKGRARPIFFSWFTWGILTGLGFVLSLRNGGGGGSLIFGLNSVACLVVAGYALFKGEKHITRSDWFSFMAAMIALFFYVFTKNAVVSVTFAAIIDVLGFVPTFRKSFDKPYDEPIMTYLLTFLSFLFSLGALESYTFVTLFYPGLLVLSNLAFVIFISVRRKHIIRA